MSNDSVVVIAKIVKLTFLNLQKINYEPSQYKVTYMIKPCLILKLIWLQIQKCSKFLIKCTYKIQQKTSWYIRPNPEDRINRKPDCCELILTHDVILDGALNFFGRPVSA